MAQAKFIPAPSNSDEVEDVIFDSYETENTTTDHDRKLDDLLDSLNTTPDSIVMVYRQPGSGKEGMTFLDSFPPDKYTESGLLLFLKDKYATGDYRIMVRVGGRLKANKLVSIEAPKVEETKREGGNSLDGVAHLLETFMARQDQLFQSMQKPQQSEEEMLRKMMLYKELFAGNAAPVVNPLEQITNTLDIMSQMGVEIGGKSDEGFGPLIDKLTPLINHAMDTPLAPEKPASIHPDIQKAEKMKLAQQIRLKMGLQYLVTMAANNGDIKTNAKMVIDQVGEKEIESVFKNPEFMTHLSNLNPKVSEYKEWFNQLAIEIKNSLAHTSEHGTD